MEQCDINSLLLAYVQCPAIAGPDEYNDKNLEYPECVAKELMILHVFFRKTKSQEYKKIAERYIQKLINLGVCKDELLSWGLPFVWHGNMQNEGFLITTSFCIDALLIWNAEFKGKYSYTIRKGINYIFSLLYFDRKCNAHALMYAPNVRENIYNATSEAAGTLIQCLDFLTSNEREIAEDILKGIHSVKKQGYWNYSFSRPDVDLLHQSYVLEGLIKAIPFLENEPLKKDLKEDVACGLSFIKDNMQPYAMERYLFLPCDPEKLSELIKHLSLRVINRIGILNNHFLEPRAWSISAYLRVLIGAGNLSLDNYEKEAGKCTDYITTFLLKENGKIRFRKNDDSEYVRQQAHCFESLTNYYLR